MNKNKKSNEGVKAIIILAVILLLIAALSLISFLSKRIPANDEFLAGNTGGNLYNRGLFCEAEGKVYFANSYDGGSLYSMNSDETEIKKLNSSGVYAINAGGNYLYYCLDNSGSGGTGLGYIRPSLGLQRSKTDGSSSARLKNDFVTTALLCGNHLYYLNYNNEELAAVYKIKTDGSEDQRLMDGITILSSYASGTLYFAGTQSDHNLYGLDTATDSIFTVMEGNIYQPVFHNDFIYYLDLGQNYRLCRYSPADGHTEVLTADRVDAFNVGNDVIFYQTNSPTEPALYRMDTAGGSPEFIASGNYTKINMTSQYAYYYRFGDDITIYRTPLYGYPEVTAFDAALQAVPPG
jgi:hypothetical protein